MVQVVDDTVRPGLIILQEVSTGGVASTWIRGPLAAVSTVQRIATTGPSGQLVDIDSRALMMATTPGKGSRGNFEDD